MRPQNPKCLKCPKLSVPEAKQQDCWDPLRCHNRRSYYRNRARNIASQALRRKDKAVETKLQVPTPSVVAAVLVLFVENPNRQDSPIYGIQAQVWKGGQVIDQTAKESCLGWKPAQITQWASDALEAIKAKYELQSKTYARQIRYADTNG